VPADRIPVIKQPMLPTLVDKPFDDDEWLFELKWDGFRAICTIRGKGAYELISRNGLVMNKKFPELAGLAGDFTRTPLVLDGEIVSLDKKGRSSFQRLQRRFKPGPGGEDDAGDVVYAVFDLLYDGRKDLRHTPLEQRKALLEKILRSGAKHAIYSKHVIGKGKALFEVARKQGQEGIVAKRRDSAYQERRSRDWLKIKAHLEQEFVVGGWTDPQGSRFAFGALLLGVYQKGALVFVGGVGSGFDGDLLRSISATLKTLATKTCPFASPPPPPIARTSHWVKPKLVAEIKFAEWTDEGLLRQPVFLGLRDDKNPKDVVRERPVER
jgi:bifunctional non-homologous end joining protein LigD